MTKYEFLDNALDENDLEGIYEDFLNDVYGDIDVAGNTYMTSTVLRVIDPTAFDVGFSDWLSGEIESGVFVEVDSETYRSEDVDEVEND